MLIISDAPARTPASSSETVVGIQCGSQSNARATAGVNEQKQHGVKVNLLPSHTLLFLSLSLSISLSVSKYIY